MPGVVVVSPPSPPVPSTSSSPRPHRQTRSATTTSSSPRVHAYAGSHRDGHPSPLLLATMDSNQDSIPTSSSISLRPGMAGELMDVGTGSSLSSGPSGAGMTRMRARSLINQVNRDNGNGNNQTMSASPSASSLTLSTSSSSSSHHVASLTPSTLLAPSLQRRSTVSVSNVSQGLPLARLSMHPTIEVDSPSETSSDNSTTPPLSPMDNIASLLQHEARTSSSVPPPSSSSSSSKPLSLSLPPPPSESGGSTSLTPSSVWGATWNGLGVGLGIGLGSSATTSSAAQPAVRRQQPFDLYKTWSDWFASTIASSSSSAVHHYSHTPDSSETSSSSEVFSPLPISDSEENQDVIWSGTGRGGAAGAGAGAGVVASTPSGYDDLEDAVHVYDGSNEGAHDRHHHPSHPSSSSSSSSSFFKPVRPGLPARLMPTSNYRFDELEMDDLQQPTTPSKLKGLSLPSRSATTSSPSSKLWNSLSSLGASANRRLPSTLQTQTHHRKPSSRQAALSSHQRPPLLPLLPIVFCFMISTLVLVVSLGSLPSPGLGRLPHNLEEVVLWGRKLGEYGKDGLGWWHVFVVLSYLFVWKQAWSVPGSILMNLLFGAMYGAAWGTIWACIWTGVGSAACWAGARQCGALAEHYLPKSLAKLRSALSLPPSGASSQPLPSATTNTTTTSAAATTSSPNDIFTSLFLARLLPFLPYSALNIASGVLSIPIHSFFWSATLGSGPWNWVTVQVGDLAISATSVTSATAAGGSTVASVATAAATATSAASFSLLSLLTPWLVVKLVMMTLVTVLPIVYKEKLRSGIQGVSELVRRWEGKLLQGGLVR